MTTSSGSNITTVDCTNGTDLPRMRNRPTLSVVLTLYTMDQIDYFKNCLDGLRNQTYENIEVVACPENEDVINAVQEYCNQVDDIDIVFHPLENVTEGLSEARNRGAEAATGDIVAFLDIDAVPDKEWAKELVGPYVQYDVLAVGGEARPVWEETDTRPYWVPPEFDWLIGSNHDEFGSEGEFVRNTYGCNISFRRDVFLELGGYDTELGKSHGFNLQGEEPSFGIKLQEAYGTAVYYQPNATINHYVNTEQQTLRWLVNRAFLQGVSKQVIESKHADSESLTEENEYLSFVLLTAFPRHIFNFATRLSIKELVFALMVLVYVGCVGSGYVFSIVRELVN